MSAESPASPPALAAARTWWTTTSARGDDAMVAADRPPSEESTLCFRTVYGANLPTCATCQCRDARELVRSLPTVGDDPTAVGRERDPGASRSPRGGRVRRKRREEEEEGGDATGTAPPDEPRFLFVFLAGAPWVPRPAGVRQIKGKAAPPPRRARTREKQSIRR